MIYTKHQKDIEIVYGDQKSGLVTIKKENGDHRQIHISLLKADNGEKEIETAIKEANQNWKEFEKNRITFN